MPRVLYLTQFVAPYRIPVLNQLARAPNFELRVLFCTQAESNREWNFPTPFEFDYCIIHKGTKRHTPGTIYWSPEIFRQILKDKPDVIIVSGFSAPTVYAWLYTKIAPSSRAYIIWSQGTPHKEQHVQGARLAMRKWLVRHSRACVGASSQACEYFVRLGAPRARVFKSYLTIDVEQFARAARAARPSRERVKAELGLAKKNILFAGRLVPLKGVNYLLEALRLVQQTDPQVGLIVLGSGPLEQEYKTWCVENNVRGVYFAGFQRQEDLAAWYTLADVFAFPTLCDDFGVVMVEAIAAGLPIVSSPFAGAAGDLLRHGKNGYIVDPREPRMFAERLVQILRDDNRRTEMAGESIRLQGECSANNAALEITRAVNLILQEKKSLQDTPSETSNPSPAQW